MTDLSVIIVTHNGWKRLLSCLNSLVVFSPDKFCLEVIVVDNASDTHIEEIEKGYPGFRFIHNRINGGFANGCNLGAKNASGEFLLFLNPDTVVKEEEIYRLIEASRNHPEYYLTACRQTDEKGRYCRTSGQFPSPGSLTGIQRSAAMFFKRKQAIEDNIEIISPDWVSGSVMMIKRELFERIKGFDEDFWMYFEDVDICKRIRNSGGSIGYFRNITIEHNHGGSSRANQKVSSITKTEVLISQHVYVNKHFNGAKKFLASLLLVFHNLLTGAVTALFGCLLFFIPKISVNILIFSRLLSYYTGAIWRGSWIGTRALNVRKTKTRVENDI